MSEQQSFERATYRKYDFSEKQGLGHLIQRYIIQYKESVAKNINWTKLKKKKILGNCQKKALELGKRCLESVVKK